MSHTGTCDEALGPHRHDDGEHEHSHSHGLVDPSIRRSRAGLFAVGVSLAVLGATAAIQVAIYVATGSVALLADLIHNFGDALTAVPLGAAFLLRSPGRSATPALAVVLAIFISACVAGVIRGGEDASARTQPEHLLGARHRRRRWLRRQRDRRGGPAWSRTPT